MQPGYAQQAYAQQSYAQQSYVQPAAAPQQAYGYAAQSLQSGYGGGGYAEWSQTAYGQAAADNGGYAPGSIPGCSAAYAACVPAYRYEQQAVYVPQPYPVPTPVPTPVVYPQPVPAPYPAPCAQGCYQAQEVRLGGDFYTGGVGVTEFGGGGGGGGGNFEVQGFGDVSGFTTRANGAWANADAYSKSVALSKSSAEAYANAQANVNVNVNTNMNMKGGYNKGGYNKGGYNKGCDTCDYQKPQPVTCNTCGGNGGVGHMAGGYGGMGHGMGGKSWGGMAPSPRGGYGGGCMTCGGGKHGH